MQSPGGSKTVLAETTRKPYNAGGSHWQGEWGNWSSTKKPVSYGCLNGVEYQYTYEIVIYWKYPYQASSERTTRR